MRKFAMAVFAILCTTVSVSPALASFDPHFGVIAKTKSGHSSPDGFGFQEKLLDPSHAVNKVGFDRGACLYLSTTSARCRVVFHFNGEIGGSGSIRASGVFDTQDDQRININGGSGDFEGAAGKVVVSDVPGRGQLLSFDVVR